jgi:hypothetical protein
MIRAFSPTRLTSLLVLVPFAALLSSPLPALAQAVAPSLGSASSFAVLGGPAVTCTDNTAPNTVADITGDVGVLLGSGFTNTACTIAGTVHAGDGAARAAYASFLMAYNNLAIRHSNPLTCDSSHRLTGTLAGLVLEPGVYCVDAVAKTGSLTLQGDETDVWIFLVDGALTGTNFNVNMIPGSGAEACNVYWWAEAAATMTTSNFAGTILAGAAITVDGGTFDGRALAMAAVTMTNPKVTGCLPGDDDDDGPPIDKCEPRDDDDDDHHGHHGKKGHHHKHGRGHHHDDDHGRDNGHGKNDDHGKDDDHERNNRNSRGSGSKGNKHW